MFHVPKQFEPYLRDETSPDMSARHRLWIFCRFGSLLERVSIKKGRYHLSASPSAGARAKPIPQAALMTFVRRTPSLRWFRSDLTAQNVALLQAERPDIIFE